MAVENSLRKSFYNWEIDVYKFLFAVIVAVFHCSRFKPEIPVFPRGYLAVEFFFIVSGFFMASKITSANTPDTGTFLLKKISPIYPVYLGALFVAIICRVLPSNPSFFEWVLHFLNSGIEILVLQEFGFNVGGFYNGVTWYISAMMIAMAVLYPLYKKFPLYFVHGVGALLISLCCYALMLNIFGRLAAGSASALIVKFRVVRAFAGISLGVFCWTCSNYVKSNFVQTQFGRYFFVVVKVFVFALIVGLIHFANRLNLPSRYDLVIAFLEFLLVFLIFSGLGRVDIPEKYSFVPKFLGLASLYIYFNHRGVIWFIQRSHFGWDYEKSMIVFTFGTLLTSFLCFMISRLLVIGYRKFLSAIIKPT